MVHPSAAPAEQPNADDADHLADVDLVITSYGYLARTPWLAILLVIAILIGLEGLLLRLNSIAFGEPRGPTAEAKASFVPMFAHLSLVLIAGIYLPSPLVVWFQHVANLLG